MTDREVMQMALVQMGINQYTVAELAPHKDVMAFNSAMEVLRAQLEQREWSGLTKEEFWGLTDKVIGLNSCCGWEQEYAKAIETKLKEKNHD